MFDQIKNMASVLGQAKQIKEKMQQLQAELGQKTVEADAGAGAVRVVVNGNLEVVAVRLDRPLLATLAGEGDETDQQMVEDLIAGATNAALVKAKELVQQEMARLTGGLNIPGLTGMPSLSTEQD